MSEASEIGEFHCCCTGDCHHDSVHDCVDSLVEHIKELAKDCKQAESIGDEYAKMYCEMHTRWVRIAKGKFARALTELIEEGKASSDGRKAIINSDVIDTVERLFAKANE